MAFEKRSHRNPAYAKQIDRFEKREATIAALAAQNTPEARAQRRKMNDQLVPKRADSLGEFWRGAKGCGKVRTRANCDANRVAKKLRAAGVAYK